MPSAKAIISLKTLQYLCDEVRINKKHKIVTGIAKTSYETPTKSKDKSADRFRIRKGQKKTEKRKNCKRSRSIGRDSEGEWTSPSGKRLSPGSNSGSKPERVREGSPNNDNSIRRSTSIVSEEQRFSDSSGESVSTDEANGSDIESVYEYE